MSGKFQWVKWKKHQGVKYRGHMQYNPPQPWGPWTKILGVVARCEGNHDSVVSYDFTGITAGFGQWTFTSGRLQKFLESLKSIPYYDFTHNVENHTNLFEDVCCEEEEYSVYTPIQSFEKFGFYIVNGKFFDIEGDHYLNPATRKNKNRMVSICMGTAKYKKFKDQKFHAMNLAKLFAKIGEDPGVIAAQIQFAKQEFKRALTYKRPPLGNIMTIANLLDGTWDTPAPALFFNLWQNNPGAAYRLFKSVKRSGAIGEGFFDLAWRKANQSRFGNWGWKNGVNKSPRVRRIKKAIKEFYNIDLSYFR